jgi:hypothetical protein
MLLDTETTTSSLKTPTNCPVSSTFPFSANAREGSQGKNPNASKHTEKSTGGNSTGQAVDLEEDQQGCTIHHICYQYIYTSICSTSPLRQSTALPKPTILRLFITLNTLVVQLKHYTRHEEPSYCYLFQCMLRQHYYTIPLTNNSTG